MRADPSALVTLAGWLERSPLKQDGDTLRFLPDRDADLRRLARFERITRASDGSVAVRLNGVDAHEASYEG